MRKIFFVSIFAASMLLSHGSPSQQNIEQNHKKLIVSAKPVQDKHKKGVFDIVGTVIDQSSREPIGKAKVTILGSQYKTETTDDGQYVLRSVPTGIYQMKAEAITYDPQILNNVIVDPERGSQKVFFSLQKTAQEPPPDVVSVQVQPSPLRGNPNPIYPSEARKAGIEGTVFLKIWVDKVGDARKVVVQRSDAEVFNQPSIDAAMKWKFSPAMLDNKPVDTWVTVPFRFRLPKEGKK